MKGTIAIALLALSGVAHADPQRDGLTVEVRAGAGVFAAGTNYGTNTDAVPLALHLSVGGFVTQRLALGMQLQTATALHQTEGGTSDTMTSTLIGPGAQVWLTSFAWVGGGAGLAHVSYMTGGVSALGFSARAGFALPSQTHNSWGITADATTTQFADHDWVTASLMLGYQYL